jgi:hypothetical protein
MAGFFGATSVQAMLNLHRTGTGKVFSGTLKQRTSGDTFTSTTYANTYLHPISHASGLSANGSPYKRTRLVLWQLGESVAPSEDDEFTDADGNTWTIETVETTLNGTANYGVHACEVYRYSA